ncbi:MAG: glycosidase [Ignavibacteriales bacterium]|nr:glycosidase [Ignavibacteriales bacterium]
MNYNPSLYEINTRVFVKRFGAETKITNVPPVFWNELAEKGIDYVWLLGIWKTSDEVIEKYCFEDDLVNSYKRALRDFKKEDVIGSPFSIDVYDVNPKLADADSLIELKSFLNSRGIKLILDFVPNHFGAGTSLLKTHPEIFLQVDEESFLKDPHTYFKPFAGKEIYFAHGRDPFFPSWQDTIQINIFSKDAREFLTDTLLRLTDVCDGVRCDMAMLLLNNVFKNTWIGALSKNHFHLHEKEFWSEAISAVKNKRADFIFIAESYWDMEWELQQLGFDFTYDKKLTDRLRTGYVKDICEHLLAEESYQKRSLRFIENHDEERAAASFGKEKSKAAAIIISTIQGMRFYHDGQLEGKKIKLPVQLGREPEEFFPNGIHDFYDRLFSITQEKTFKHGNWKLLRPGPAWEGNISHNNMLAWEWNYNDEKRVVVVNYSESVSVSLLKLDVSGYPENFELLDLLNDQTYIRSSEEVYHTGLYIELKPWQAHILKY